MARRKLSYSQEYRDEFPAGPPAAAESVEEIKKCFKVYPEFQALAGAVARQNALSSACPDMHGATEYLS